MIILSVLYYGGSLVTTDVITVGNLASFVLYAAYVGIGLSGVSTFYAEVMKGLGASSRIFEIIDGAEKEKERTASSLAKISPAHIESLPDLSGDIVLKDVHFSYPTRPDAPIFDGLSVVVPAQSSLAIVGGSGSGTVALPFLTKYISLFPNYFVTYVGKSTLASLILRFYDPSRGNISIGGTDVRTIDPTLLRQRTGIVAQVCKISQSMCTLPSYQKMLLSGADLIFVFHPR